MSVLRVDLRLGRPDFTLEVAGDVPPGLTSVFGPSGCGKTTLLRCIAGLERAAGRVALGDAIWQEGRRHLPPHKRGVGVVFQDARLFDHLDVAGNLRFAEKRAPTPPERERIIAMCDLAPLLSRRPAVLSGGERQRVALARALMASPLVLLLDEPLSALDQARREELLPILEALRDSAMIPMIHVSHDLSEVARLADRLWVMEAGRVQLHGPLSDVLSDPHAAARLGPRQAGAVVEAEVGAYDPRDDLTALRVGEGTLWLPGRVGAPGETRRLRIPAHDVTLMLTPPQGLSALSHLPVTITDLAPGHGPGVAVGLASGEARLIARITKRSLREMGLAPGMRLHALLKATALSPGDTGG